MTASGSQPLRILLTEDHASTRFGMKQILKEGLPGVIFGEAADASSTLAQITRRAWDLLLLDISLPDRHGLDVLVEVKMLRPALPVLIYSAHPEDQFALPALRAGAAGYLTKERAPEELCVSVQAIVRGGSYFSAATTARLQSTPGGGRPRPGHERLSEREFQVLRLTAAGKAGKTIAVELGLSQKTVSTYRVRVLRKLRLGSAAELVRYAVQHGLV